MEFVDFRSLRKSPKIDLLFPKWQEGETVAFLSPHDDDVLLGAGYLLKATVENSGIPLLLVFCSGDAGYSNPEEKDTITQRRKQEAIQAYGALGVKEENIHSFDIPDFSLMPFVNRNLIDKKGLFEEQVRLFRKERVSRVVFSSGYFEHWDHTAVFSMGIYTSPQAGDPVLADIGEPFAAQSHYIYSVWGDFEPSESKENQIRADKGILVKEEIEEEIRSSIQYFTSQRKIFKKIIDYREKRKSSAGYLELYKSVDIRPQTDFKPYFELLHKCQTTEPEE
jgi:LmbE family N-acetylglucosaminyl deacetylase